MTPDSRDASGLVAIPALRDELGLLLSHALQAHMAALAAAFEHCGSARGYYVLATAATADLNQLEIGRLLGLDRTVMVRVVDELEKSGLIVRRPAPTDRRARIVTPTDSGRRALQGIRERIRAAEDQLLAPLSASQRQTLMQCLVQLAQKRPVDTVMNACPGENEARKA